MKSIHCLTLAFALGATTNGFGQATLQFTAASYSVPENAPNVILTVQRAGDTNTAVSVDYVTVRSEEHTSELQSQSNLVCRLLLEKKKKPNSHAAFSERTRTPRSRSDSR